MKNQRSPLETHEKYLKIHEIQRKNNENIKYQRTTHENWRDSPKTNGKPTTQIKQCWPVAPQLVSLAIPD